MSKPLCVDLFCGLGGFTEGFLAEGWRCVGFDITRHVYGAERYPAQLVLQDVLTIHGSQFRNADIIVASPPCQQYSWLAMPWSRSTDPNNSKKAKEMRRKWETEGPDNRLFDACFRIQREAIEAARTPCDCCRGTGRIEFGPNEGYGPSWVGCSRCWSRGYTERHIPLIVENVRGAQPWVGRAKANYGSFYLWGDVPALMPKAWKVPPKRAMDDLKNGVRAAPSAHLPGGRMIAVEDGTKFSAGTGGWFGDYKSRAGRGLSQISGNSSRSAARKAASAKIAKIPLPLSTHIARGVQTMSDAKIKNAGEDFDAANLRNAREFLRTPEGRPPFELDWARRVLERLGKK